ncbi:SH3 domain-containing protein [Planotetraspora sp. A-T 1434]|uniref:SH3 domain-containing protein n=1 Tax=Planotetraspora sp. A-T 1434 TaxID=2979219 RepID=UPI0021C1AABB|nr:SH3 domain-containing protein [Planotetraspora sp. A-T 1434]MCT9933252.1 SH3 domain-containing protein [Planotetraspora sp. A-T 1434]
MTIAKRVVPVLAACAAAGWLMAAAAPAQAAAQATNRATTQTAAPATAAAAAHTPTTFAPTALLGKAAHVTGAVRVVPRPMPREGRPTLACTYRLHRVRSSSFLNVRKGPGLRFRPVGKLSVADGRFAGSCGAHHGWVAVKSAKGEPGWASAGFLRRFRASHPVVRPALACSYRVTNLRTGGLLNVRKGPGLRFRPVGTLKAADGRFAGSCGAHHGWVAVKSAKGKPGWASGHYLAKQAG